MASNGNGDWIKWVLGILIITVLPFVGSTIWSNDKDSRSRDDKLCEKIVCYQQDQQKVNQEILIALTDIRADMRYLKSKAQ